MKSKIIQTIIITLISFTVSGQQRSNYRFDHFKSKANFSRANFDSVANFRRSYFDLEADFYDAHFDSVAVFNGANFDSVADFNDANFDSEVYFTLAQFKSEANFSRANFDSVADFIHTRFYSVADFFGAHFDSEADFGWAKFDSVANFSDAKFYSVADFFGVHFDSEVYFNGAHFDSEVYFQYAYLPQVLNFNKVEINGEIIDFTNSLVDSIPDKRCRIYLYGTDISKLNLRYEMFKLMFEDSIPFDLKSNVYEKLLKQTELLGYKKSYEILDKEYKEITYLEGFEKPKWFRNWLEKNWWGYGYNKELIIRNTILLFLFFSFTNCLLFSYISSNVYEIPRLLKTRNEIESKNKFLLYLKIFPIAAFYTGFIFFGLSFSIDKLKYSENLKGWRILNLIYFFTVYLVGIVCLGYLANYVLSS